MSLGDTSKSRLSIGKRVLKEELSGREAGEVPLYSANVREPFGHLAASNLEDFTHPSVLFGIDGDFELAVTEAGAVSATTDHCGRIEVLDPHLDPHYCRAAIALALRRAEDVSSRMVGAPGL